MRPVAAGGKNCIHVGSQHPGPKVAAMLAEGFSVKDELLVSQSSISARRSGQRTSKQRHCLGRTDSGLEPQLLLLLTPAS